MKILYIVSTLKRSGPTRQLYNLIQYLSRNQFEPHIVTLSSEPKDSYWQEYEELGIFLHSLELSRIQALFLARRNLERLVNEIQPDLIHTQGIRADVTASWSFKGLAKMCTVRNFPYEDYTMTYGKLQGRLMTSIHMNSIRRLDKVVGVSTSVTKYLSQRFILNNVQTIQNGIDLSNYFPVDLQKKDLLRQVLKLPKSAVIWICSGNLSERKNPLFLISAWQKKFGNSDCHHLVFIGDGSLQKSCQKKVEKDKNIHVVGRVLNVSDYLKASDYYISSSKAEGFPNAVLEAMACGLPVLLSAIPPHQEILELNPSVGKQFDLDSEEKLVDAIQHMLKVDYLEASVACRKLIEEKLSAQKMSQQYQDVYRQLRFC